jgi:hypothetical protein
MTSDLIMTQIETTATILALASVMGIGSMFMGSLVAIFD